MVWDENTGQCLFFFFTNGHYVRGDKHSNCFAAVELDAASERDAGDGGDDDRDAMMKKYSPSVLDDEIPTIQGPGWSNTWQTC